MKFKIILYLSFSLLACAEKRTYEGYSVFKVVPKTNEHVEVLRNLQKNRVVEFWDDDYGINRDVRAMVSKDNKDDFLEKIQAAKMETNELIKDLQKVIDDQLRPSNQRSDTSFLSYNWNEYQNLDKINSWLDELASTYPNIVSTVVMGRSFENREIKGIKIDYHPERSNKLIGMLEGTCHAREWISPATITWIVKEFLTSNDPEVKALAENFEWHIFPVVNPDGYSYTFTTHRMWRKNRSTQSSKSCAESGADDDMSNGVDLNRNFDFEWMSIGASNDSCSNTYAGPSPASEPETQAISQYVTNLNQRGRLIYYIAFHSYTQLIIIPYSHVDSTDVLEADNYADMFEIASRGAEKLQQRYGTTYIVGISSDVMYPMSGTSFDWVKYSANVPVSYLIELRDLGEYGFLLPTEQIVPNNLEIMDALLEMDRTTRRLGYYSGTQSIICSFSVIVFCLILSLVIEF